MKSYARNQGTQTPYTVLRDDILANDAESLTEDTVYSYTNALRQRLECDTVIHLRNGSFGLIEIKLGGDHLIEEGASNLKTFSAKIDTKKMKEPAFLMVLTGTGKYAYRREDGVYVVPIGCLKD